MDLGYARYCGSDPRPYAVQILLNVRVRLAVSESLDAYSPHPLLPPLQVLRRDAGSQPFVHVWVHWLIIVSNAV